MTDPSLFDTSVRREEAEALHEELVSRLHQRGIRTGDTASSDDLADLLSALDAFDRAVERAGGDLFIDSPNSSQPERSDFVVPRQYDDETVRNYTQRILAAAERVGHAEM